MFKNLFFILLFLFVSYNFSYATWLSLNIEWWTSKEVYYNENVSFNALATFPEWCSSTWITWTKTIWWFPFPSIITLWTWPNLTTSFTSNTNITVTASCDASSVVTFLFVTIKDPTVNAWGNTNYNTWDLVNLSGSITWTDSSCTVFNYEWEQISWPGIVINNPTQNEFNSSTYSNANFIFPDTTENIVLKLKVTPQSCYHAGNTYSGTVTFSKNINTWSRKRSYSSRMREEAEKLFYDNESIENIKLNLKLEKQDYSPILHFYWDNIWWNWQVKYVIEYSTENNFSIWNTILFNTTDSFYQFIEYWLDANSFIHYFRIKSEYYWKQSNYSNIVKYYSEDYLDISCKKEKKLVNFDDIFYSYDFLLDDVFKVKCNSCER